MTKIDFMMNNSITPKERQEFAQWNQGFKDWADLKALKPSLDSLPADRNRLYSPLLAFCQIEVPRVIRSLGFIERGLGLI
jgi:hypothetical protein